MKNNLFSNPNAFLLKKKITHLEKEVSELKNEYNEEVSCLIRVNGKKQTLVGRESIGKPFFLLFLYEFVTLSIPRPCTKCKVLMQAGERVVWRDGKHYCHKCAAKYKVRTIRNRR